MNYLLAYRFTARRSEVVKKPFRSVLSDQTTLSKKHCKLDNIANSPAFFLSRMKGDVSIFDASCSLGQLTEKILGVDNRLIEGHLIAI